MGTMGTMGTTLQNIYDGFAKTYEQNRGKFDMTEILTTFYNQLGSEQDTLLDLGCGAGEPLARFFVDRDWTVTGVDFSRQMLDLAEKYVPEMQTIHSDIRDVDFEANQFSAITASYSLFHIPASDHLSMFKKFYTWLKPDARALFTYATKEYTGSSEFEGYKEFMDQKLFYSHKKTDELFSDLENLGFCVESADYRTIGGETFLWVTIKKDT